MLFLVLSSVLYLQVILLYTISSIGGILGSLFQFKFFGSIDMSVIECLIFGSLIAATDPVSTLAVFGALAVEPMLSMIM